MDRVFGVPVEAFATALVAIMTIAFGGKLSHNMRPITLGLPSPEGPRLTWRRGPGDARPDGRGAAPSAAPG